ncbi:MAG: Glu-tRNA(Gln) amidotransferase subunit GatE [Nitrososphaerota archaeon]
MNYKELGLRVGIEIHRQLDTERKLFCSCRTSPTGVERTIEFTRRLRETQSELGEIDPAARFEMKKMRRIIYRADLGCTCLVEMDEEPPHMLNSEAVRIALTVARLLDARPVDEIHVMRKIVIDGSNTTGFQRTCIVATGGRIMVDGQEIPIQTITLEEDAAKLVETKPTHVVYDLSRLGIPLIEVSTAPVITDPEQAAKAAYAIGKILRATGKVKRGIGTVRQDLNISIKGTGIVEVKGVQELDLIPKIIDYEVRRLSHLLHIKEKLRERGVTPEKVQLERPVDVTDIFSSTASRVLLRKIGEGGRVYALRLPGFAGLLRSAGDEMVRLGRDLSEYAKAWTGVEGIFHSDELPNYGISQAEVDAVASRLGLSSNDAFVMIAEKTHDALEALEAVRSRAAEAVVSVPGETRGPRPDGTTFYMRPRPGSARMYPETDIPPLIVSKSLLEEIESSLPPTLDELASILSNKYRLSRQLVWELIDSERLHEFEELVAIGVQPSFAASFLTEGYKELRREGHPVDEVDFSKVKEYFRLVVTGQTAKESAKQVLAYLSRNPDASASDAIDKLGLRAPPLEEVIQEIDRLIDEALSIQPRSEPSGHIMGRLMKLYRGRVDGAVLSELVKKRLSLRQ